ncbi:MAG: enoyl-CoA hydratase/isomerase family protein [Acidobacteriia bacterium]|nr:enoyl-CoA hydratase/isomerase family protein [Terriglobia bacterium]
MDGESRNGQGVTMENTVVENKVRLEFTHQGQVARITLSAPKANILDKAMMLGLHLTLEGLTPHTDLKAIVLAGAGPHFSFGASIEEHLPDQIGDTLTHLRKLLLKMAGAPAPLIAAVRGQCMGGGFELALACDLIVAEESAQFALPEIKLGVFPPAGAALLPVRMGAGRAAEMVLTGASWTAQRAAAAGLINKVFPNGELEAQLDAWLESEFLPRSAAALHFAAQAARLPLVRALEIDLPALEHIYLNELMQQPDAAEGILAFLEKRQPHWSVERQVPA